jgi:hypothetical protein
MQNDISQLFFRDSLGSGAILVKNGFSGFVPKWEIAA